MSIEFGIDVFLTQKEKYSGCRFGLVTNHAAVTKHYIPTRLALVQAGFSVVRLFSPEHGLDAVGEDGRLMKNGKDELTGLPIVSLYGNKLAPDSNDLEGIDVLILDLPDIGCRFYTYLWTMTHVLEACAQNNKRLIILDRPNPLSGNSNLMEGPVLQKECASFIGRWELPLRHSYTFGELAKFWRSTRSLGLDLEVIEVNGWKRTAFLDDWQLSFVPTSPAITDFQAVLVYPGSGLFEATNLSEGRGTATPFRVAGATWLKAQLVVVAFNDLRLPGVVARPITFTPLAGKYTNEVCHGVMFHVVDKENFRPVVSLLLFIKLVKEHHPLEFEWATYPTHVNPTGELHLDKLLGIPNAEALFELNWGDFRKSVLQLLDCSEWAQSIEEFLLYS